MTFENMGLAPPILKALTEIGYENPTPIQSQAIPVLLERHDLLGCAQTGTGKTAAFGLPIIDLLYRTTLEKRKNRKIRALIVTPTRELAIQIGDSFRDYAKYSGIHHAVIFGGVKQGRQTQELKRGVDILVATPGRLLDLMGQGYISLAHLEFFVLDEADRMLDMGFIHDIRKILKAIPAKRQSLFFSATMPNPIQDLAATILRKPKEVMVAPESTAAETVEQFIYFVDKKNKRKLLLDLLDNPEIESALVFSRTKYGADKIARALSKKGIKSNAIHGNKSQNQRQAALKGFRKKHTRVLVATDIAARGIDVDDLTHVINYDLPNEPETYVHRIGRTGRAGASGVAFSFCDTDERAYLRDIQKLLGRKIEVREEHPYPPEKANPFEEELPGSTVPSGFPMPGKKKSSGKKKRRHRGRGRGPGNGGGQSGGHNPRGGGNKSRGGGGQRRKKRD